jgi:hypothetical protein
MEDYHVDLIISTTAAVAIWIYNLVSYLFMY